MADKENNAIDMYIKLTDQSIKMSDEAIKQSQTNSEMSVDDSVMATGDKHLPSSQDFCQRSEALANSNNIDSSGNACEGQKTNVLPPASSSMLDGELRPEGNCFSTLKKDDSGIVLLKSPGADRSSDDVDHASRDDDGKPDRSLEAEASERVNRPSTSNESEGVVADFVDTEEGGDAVQGGGGSGGGDGQSVTTAESENSSEPDMFRCQLGGGIQSVLVVRPIRLPVKSKRRLPLDSDDDDDDDNDNVNNDDSGEESMQHDRTKDSSSDKSDDDMDIDLEPPSDTWRPLFELEQQQRGHSNKILVDKLFRNRCGASINLVQRLTLYSKLEHHEGCVNALHFNEQGTLLASGSDDLDIIVWKWVEKKPFFVFESGHRSNVFQSKFMPYTGDTHIVSCARDGQVRLAELSSTGTCKGTRKLAQHKGAAHKLALLQDSSHVFYSCGEDAVTFEIDLRQEKPNKLSTTKENNRKVPLYSIHSNPFKSYEYCVSGKDHHIRVFDKRMASEGENSGLVKKYSPHHLQNSTDNDIKANVTCAVYNYNGQEILATYNDEDIYLFDNTHSDGADAIHRYRGHRNNATVKGVNFYGPKSEFVITGSDCGNIFLWEKNSEKVINFFQGDNAGVVNVLEPHPHGPIIATSGLDHDVKVWMPLAREPTKLDGLKRVVKRNRKEREEDRRDPSDAIDSTTFWRLMQHFRRTARARLGEETSSDSNDSENSDDDDSENENGVQCVPS